jgi:SMC interacting uncharacterized protein involved in chromosome segregation
MCSGRGELRKDINGVKADISAVTTGQEEFKNDVSAGQEKVENDIRVMKNDVEDRILNSISTVKDDLNAVELKINVGQEKAVR